MHKVFIVQVQSSDSDNDVWENDAAFSTATAAEAHKHSVRQKQLASGDDYTTGAEVLEMSIEHAPCDRVYIVNAEGRGTQERASYALSAHTTASLAFEANKALRLNDADITTFVEVITLDPKSSVDPTYGLYYAADVLST